MYIGMYDGMYSAFSQPAPLECSQRVRLRGKRPPWPRVTVRAQHLPRVFDWAAMAHVHNALVYVMYIPMSFTPEDIVPVDEETIPMFFTTEDMATGQVRRTSGASGGCVNPPPVVFHAAYATTPRSSGSGPAGDGRGAAGPSGPSGKGRFCAGEISSSPSGGEVPP